MGNEINDPGIGTSFESKTKRVINSDGSFNIIKKGAKHGFKDIFKFLLEISWFRFFCFLFLTYVLMNLVFTTIYMLLGYEHIHGISPDGAPVFMQVFFFSVQTFTTVGYGVLSPTGIGPQFTATVEAFVGFLSFSLATGLAYGRFSRPNSKIIFSKYLLYSKFQEGHSIKLKLANERDNVLLEVTAKVILSVDYKVNGEITKSYYNLPLQISRVEMLPYTWTLVHPIDEESPLWDKTPQEIVELNPEFLVLIKGFDETFSQYVHSKHSFIHEDIQWNMKFNKIFAPNEEGVVEFDINDINSISNE